MNRKKIVKNNKFFFNTKILLCKNQSK